MVTKGGTASASKEETKSSAESNDLERDGRSLPCRQRPKLGAPAASNALVLGLVQKDHLSRTQVGRAFELIVVDAASD